MPDWLDKIAGIQGLLVNYDSQKFTETAAFAGIGKELTGLFVDGAGKFKSATNINTEVHRIATATTALTADEQKIKTQLQALGDTASKIFTKIKGIKATGSIHESDLNPTVMDIFLLKNGVQPTNLDEATKVLTKIQMTGSNTVASQLTTSLPADKQSLIDNLGGSGPDKSTKAADIVFKLCGFMGGNACGNSVDIKNAFSASVTPPPPPPPPPPPLTSCNPDSPVVASCFKGITDTEDLATIGILTAHFHILSNIHGFYTS